jgi:hemerythrin-like metal-binding protein
VISVGWSDDLSTGNERVDSQHRMLFQMLDDCIDDLCNRQFDFMLTLKALREYAEMHFNYEEDCLSRTSCPERHQCVNKAAHDQFRTALDEFQARYEAMRRVGRGRLTREIVQWIQHWLRDHIGGIDRALGAYGILERESKKELDHYRAVQIKEQKILKLVATRA